MEGFGRRAGTFFLVLGVFLIVLFVASDAVRATYYPLICSGAILLVLGWFLRVRNRAPEQGKPSGRFGIFGGKPKNQKDGGKKP